MNSKTTHRFPAQGRCHCARARRACPPGSEVTSRVQVRMTRVTAMFALKVGPFRPVAPFGMPTSAAPLTGVARIFFDHLDASPGRLVVNHVQQLSKGPTVQHPVDLAGALGATPNTQQFLNVEHTAGRRYPIHDLATHAVVFIGNPSGLLSFGAFKHTRFTFLLQRLPVAPVPASHRAQGLAVEKVDGVGAGQHGQVGQAQIQTEVRAIGSRNILTLDGQIKYQSRPC